MKKTSFRREYMNIFLGDALKLYKKWPSPTVIIADGPYGISSFPGDLNSVESLDKWYEPHIKAWSKSSIPATTLWFWNTEIGWANVHPIFKKYGWEYRNCHIWNKGISHIAGNSNTQSLRKLPVVTEVCVQYVRKVELKSNITQNKISLKQWLREEWSRTGLSLDKTNEACGVKNAATRKYFTKDHLWYFPPEEAFEKLTEYANKYGKPNQIPYFSTNGKKPLSKIEWSQLRSKFKCPLGVTNVWDLPAVRGKERIKNGYRAVHINQKPLSLMNLIIESSSDKEDVVWEPFGGLCSGGIAASELKRRTYCAEINPTFFSHASERASEYSNLTRLPLF